MMEEVTQPILRREYKDEHPRLQTNRLHILTMSENLQMCIKQVNNAHASLSKVPPITKTSFQPWLK